MQKATLIHLTSLDGKPTELLSQYEGSPILILFFNIQCLGCTGRAIPLAYEYMQEFEGLKVVAIHSRFNEPKVIKQDILDIFTSKTLPFPIYFDKGHEAYDQYECEGTPHWILIDKDGNIYRSIYGSQDGAQTRLGYALADLVAG